MGDVFSLGTIKPPNTRPAWKVFYEETGTGAPLWNFLGKYLVDKNGKIMKAGNLDKDIPALLAASPAEE